MKQVDMY